MVPFFLVKNAFKQKHVDVEGKSLRVMRISSIVHDQKPFILPLTQNVIYKSDYEQPHAHAQKGISHFRSQGVNTPAQYWSTRLI